MNFFLAKKLLPDGGYLFQKFILDRCDIHKKITQHRLKPIYISLYGVNDTNDITKKIFFEVNSVLGSAAGKKLSEIAKVGLSALHLTTDHFKEETWLNLKRNIVLCFDDLERMALSIEKGLGFINNVMEHDGLKVIIIANEGEILEIDKYYKIKEKLIGRTIEFAPDMKEIISNIIGSYSGEYKKFLLSNQDTIFDVFKRSNETNLRLLKRGIHYYYDVFNVLKSENKMSDYGKKTLVFTLAVSLEKKPQDLKELLEIESEFYLHYVLHSLDDKKEKTPLSIFYNKYYGDGQYEKYAEKYILDYILNGIFNFSVFAGRFKIDQKEEVNPVAIFLSSDVLELSDEIFEDSVSKVLDLAENGGIELDLYLDLFNVMHYLTAQGLTKMDESTLTEKFKKGIKKSSETSIVTKSRHAFIDESLKTSDAHKEIKSLIDEAITKIQEKQNKQIVISLLDLLPDYEAFRTSYFNENQSYQWKPIFNYCDPEDVFKKIIALNNTSIRGLCLLLRKRYEPQGAEFEPEYDNLRILRDKLKTYLLDKELKLSYYLINQLSIILDQVCSRPLKVK